MILEAKFTESSHELPCDASVAVVVNEGGGGEIPNSHINNKNNPHRVTAEQVGAVTPADLQAALDSLEIPEGGGGAVIDDEGISADKTWSSQKIDEIVGDIASALDELHNYAQGLINGGEA